MFHNNNSWLFQMNSAGVYGENIKMDANDEM